MVNGPKDRDSAQFSIAVLLKDAAVRRLLMATASLHVGLSLVFFLVGKYRLVPDMIDESGVGLGYSLDSSGYLRNAVELADRLRHAEWTRWLYADDLHGQSYSILFALLEPVFGPSIICAEPLNLFYYLATLALTGYLAWKLFDRQAALLAMAMTSIFPSILLHTLQLVRDPLFIAAFLVCISVQVCFLSGRNSPRANTIAFLTGVTTSFVMLKLKGDMWELVVGASLLGFATFLTKLWFKDRNLMRNLPFAFVLLLIVLTLPLFTSSKRHRLRPATDDTPAQAYGNPAAIERTIRLRRNFYRRFPDAGSNLDSDVRIESTSDLIVFLPRALEIGALAPFPNMWFEQGKQSGSIGRAVAGAETCFMYGLIVFTLCTVFYHRRTFGGFYLFFSIFMGFVALGGVVVNVAALYRMRLPFWILIVILACPSIYWTCGRLIRGAGLRKPLADPSVPI